MIYGYAVKTNESVTTVETPADNRSLRRRDTQPRSEYYDKSCSKNRSIDPREIYFFFNYTQDKIIPKNNWEIIGKKKFFPNLF